MDRGHVQAQAPCRRTGFDELAAQLADKIGGFGDTATLFDYASHDRGQRPTGFSTEQMPQIDKAGSLGARNRGSLVALHPSPFFFPRIASANKGKRFVQEQDVARSA